MRARDRVRDGAGSRLVFLGGRGFLLSEVNVATPMGTTSSTASSSGAPGGSAAPNGTSLEAALAQIEEEQLQKVRPRPSMPLTPRHR